MGLIKHIFFDAANTLIHKPDLWERINSALTKHGHNVPMRLLKQKHKLLSEEIKFPDRTSKDFYMDFNARYLESLGLKAKQELLDDIFNGCTYLPWKRFDDTIILSRLETQDLNIISNFNSGLKQILQAEFGPIFKNIFVSESQKLSKPDVLFYKAALDASGYAAEETLVVGDSIRLDVEPALKAGMSALLIDREEVYPEFEKRIVSLEQLTRYL